MHCVDWTDDRLKTAHEKEITLDVPDNWVTYRKNNLGKVKKRNKGVAGGYLMFWGMLLPSDMLFLEKCFQQNEFH